MTELLPSPLHLLWLANQQAVKPAYVKEQLLPCIERVNILDTEYMEDIVAVYAGSKETDGRTNHDIITQIRSNYIKNQLTQTLTLPHKPSSVQQTRLSRIILGVSRTSTFAAHGDMYLYGMLMNNCEPWRTAMFVHGRPPYQSISEQYGESTNDLVRPLLTKAIKNVLADADLKHDLLTVQHLCAACATLCEICSDNGPKIYCNTHVAEVIGTDFPKLTIFNEEFDITAGNAPVGIVLDKTLFAQVHVSTVDLLLNWLSMAFDTRPAPFTGLYDLYHAVFGGKPSSLTSRAGILPDTL